jgi:hypothetical protein
LLWKIGVFLEVIFAMSTTTLAQSPNATLSPLPSSSSSPRQWRKRRRYRTQQGVANYNDEAGNETQDGGTVGQPSNSVTAPPLSSSSAAPILHVDSASVEATYAALEIEDNVQFPVIPSELSPNSKSDRRLFGMLGLPIRRRQGHQPNQNSNNASPLNTNGSDQNQHQQQQRGTIYDSNISDSQATYYGGRMETDGIMKSSSQPKQHQQQPQPHSQQNHPQHWFGRVSTNEPITRAQSLSQTTPVDANSFSKMNSGWWPQSLPPITATTAPAAALETVRSHSFPPAAAASVDVALSQHIYVRDDEVEEEDLDGDSLRDFDASEWTPPDSSYGAAIPVAGWIPKSWRRSMEWIVLAAVAAIVVVLIVRTSLKANDNNNSGGSNSKRYHYTNNDVVATVTDDNIGTETVVAADGAEWNDDYYKVNQGGGSDEVVDDDQQKDSDDAIPADDAENVDENAENGANRPLWLFL